MTHDLRPLLHLLAERFADSLEAPIVNQPTSPTTPPSDRHILTDAIAMMAEGDVSLGVAARAAGTREGEKLAEALRKVRDLVLAARGAVSAGTDRFEDVRAAAERAADGTSRQRLAIDKTLEQLRQMIQRTNELATNANDIGELADRSALLALNTGIEGLRVGGEVARTLGALGEDLRKISQKTAGGARDLVGGLKACAEQAKAAVTALEDARGAARVAADEATKAASIAASALRSEVALATAVGGFRALDEETEAVVAKLDASADRLEREIVDARARMGALDPAAQGAIRDALVRVERAAAAGGTRADHTNET